MSLVDVDRVSLLRARFPERFVAAVFIAPGPAGPKGDVYGVDLGALHDAGDLDELSSGGEPVNYSTSDTASRKNGTSRGVVGGESGEEGGGVYRASVNSSQMELVERLVRSEDGQLSNNRRALLLALKRAVGAKNLTAQLDEGRGGAMHRGYMSRTSPVMWSPHMVRAVELLETVSPIVQSCVSVIKQLVLSDGIKFQRCNAELLPSPEFQEFVDTHLQSFAYQCIESILRIGVVPICYRYDPSTGQRIPYVPRIGTYAIRVEYVRGAPFYRFLWVDRVAFYERRCDQQSTAAAAAATPTSFDMPGAATSLSQTAWSAGGVEDPSVEILHNFGYEITDTGRLTSKYVSVLKLVSDEMRTVKTRQVADALRAAPPIATEYAGPAGDAATARILQRGAFVSTVATIGTADDLGAGTIYGRTDQEQAQYADLLCLYEQATGMDMSAHFEIPRDVYCADEVGGRFVRQSGMTTQLGAPAQSSSQYHVAANRRLAALPQAQAATDTIDMLRYIDTKICAVFGVPLSYANGDPRRVGDDIVPPRLSHDIDWMRKTVAGILTHTCNRLYLADDVERVMAVADRRRARNRTSGGGGGGGGPEERELPYALLTESELYAAESVRRVHISFASSITDDPDQLSRLFGLGAITQAYFSARLARRNGIDPSQMCPIDGELPPEARRFFLPEYADYARFREQVKENKRAAALAEEQAAAATQDSSASASASSAAAATTTSSSSRSAGSKRKASSDKGAKKTAV